MRRRHISDHTKLAVLVTAWLEIPHNIAKEMSENEIIGLIEIDHFPYRHVDGGKAVHWNLRPLLRADHKIKTKFDAADRAKERRVRRAVDVHAQRMLLKGWHTSLAPEIATAMKPKRRWPKRPFPRRVKL